MLRPVALALLLTGCAGNITLRNPEMRPVLVSAATAATVLQTIQAAEIAMVCGRPEAPPPGQCVTLDLHRTIQGQILQAAELDQQAVALIRALPAGEAPPLQLQRLVLEIDVLVERILVSLPDSSQTDLLRARLAVQ